MKINSLILCVFLPCLSLVSVNGETRNKTLPPSIPMIELDAIETAMDEIQLAESVMWMNYWLTRDPTEKREYLGIVKGYQKSRGILKMMLEASEIHQVKLRPLPPINLIAK